MSKLNECDVKFHQKTSKEEEGRIISAWLRRYPLCISPVLMLKEGVEFIPPTPNMDEINEYIDDTKKEIAKTFGIR